MKFRKKPVVIEALQWDGWNELEMSGFCPGASYKDYGGGPYLQVITMEGTMTASPGDWIIKGVKGEFYPCKPDIFAATYEAVEE